MRKKKNAVEIEHHQGIDYESVSPAAVRAAARERPELFRDSGRVLAPRPGGNAPDKRTRIDPAPAKIPLRSGGTVLF